MSNEATSQSGWDVLLRMSHVGLGLSLVVLVLGALFGLAGIALVQPERLVPLAVLLVSASAFNLALPVLNLCGLSDGAVRWLARMGNIVFLTWAVSVTGGFASPLLALYAVYFVVVSWEGMLGSLVLAGLSWAALALVAPPAGPVGWLSAATAISVLLMVALTAAVFARRHARSCQEVELRDREMAFLREAGRSLSASLDPQEVLAETLGRANELLDVEAASLALADRKTGGIKFELAIGGGNEAVKGMQMDAGEGIVGQVIKEGRSLLVPDVSADPRWYGGVDAKSGYQTHSILCVPLRVKGRIIGALEMVNKRGGAFTERDQHLLSSLADLAAQSIENARLYREVQEHAERLQVAYEEVQQLDELKSAFIRNVSHELRTPLALIGGYVDLLLDGQFGPLPAEQRRSLSIVAQKVQELIRLVDDIITLQTIGAMGFKLEVLSVVALIEMAVAGISQRAEQAGVSLALDVCPAEKLPPVWGDAARLRQVFDHLLDNAVKFSPSGGEVGIDLFCEGDMVCVQIEDNGIGVPTDQLERIFDRFYQVDAASTRRFGGTGLGLALVKEVVEAHGGAVWVESEGVPGQGSTFSVFLPACEKQVIDPLRMRAKEV